MGKTKINKKSEKLWWVLKNNDESLIRYGMLKPGNVLESGLSNLKSFNTEVSWANHLLEYNLVITGETSQNIIYSGGTWSVLP
jgi:hypothetical protein